MSVDGKISPVNLRKYGFGPDKVFDCFVATDNKDGGAIIGYSSYAFTFLTVDGLSVFLQDLYVKPAYRSRGIGVQLLRQVAKVAVQKGCNKLEWYCMGWNTATLEMYKAKGSVDLTVDEDWHVMSLSGEKLIELTE